jgi:gluconate:H+ symporter, GntP family
MVLQQITALVVSIAFMVWLILRSRLSAFPALILGALAMGLLTGMEPVSVATEIAAGVGNTMKSIGMVIGLGVMLGKLLEQSGAAKSLALAFIRWFGKGREPAAMAGAGYVVSIPIFSDSGFVILFELAKALSRVSKRSILLFSFALSAGLGATHLAVPPTPGPIAVAEFFGVDLGVMIFYGIIVSIPMTIVGVLIAYWVEKQIYHIPDGKGGWTREKPAESEIQADSFADASENLPGAFVSFLPIFLPLVLILLRTTMTTIAGPDATSTFLTIVSFLGQPYVAILVGLIAGMLTLGRATPQKKMSRIMNDSLGAAGIIIFVTCGGGAFGHIIRTSGVGEAIGQMAVNANLPLLILPFVVTVVLKIAQGSGTVAMLTSAAITAPIFANVDINPVLPALMACMGGMFMSHFNDSFFWVFTKLNGIEEMETFKYHTLPKCVEGLAGVAMVLILSIFI